MTLARADGARPDSARSAFTSPPRDRVAAPGREDGRWNVRDAAAAS
jgi:hypothetical protein